MMYVREICADLGYDMSEPSVIFEDNKACISISTGDTDKKRTKHIAKHWHFVREKCAAGLVVLKYLETALQVADMFTKQIFPKHLRRERHQRPQRQRANTVPGRVGAVSCVYVLSRVGEWQWPQSAEPGA